MSDNSHDAPDAIRAADGAPEQFTIAADDPAVYDEIVEYAVASHSYAGG